MSCAPMIWLRSLALVGTFVIGASPVAAQVVAGDAPSIVNFPSYLFDPLAQGPRPADPPAWFAEGRACDGCPRRSVGRALIDTTGINVIYELANLARGQVTAHITPKSWWANMQQGWVWDLDEFLVNQIGHPYQGSNYFNAGRSNGLNFWESAGITAFGSGTWEYFGETNHASVNDLVNTTLGGMALGEMFHRVGWLVRDTRATGRGRLMKELGAMLIDPATGLNRFISGDSSRVSEKPAEMVPTALGGVVLAGALWRGSNDTRAVDESGQPFLELDLVYGDPTTGRSRTPYDAFGVQLRFGGGGAFSEAKVRGRLVGQPFDNNRFQVNVSQDYDFNKNEAYQFGAQSFSLNAAYNGKFSSRTSLWVAGWGGVMVLGAVDSIPLTGIPPEEEEEPDGESPGQGVSEGPRYYDYGPGTNFGARAAVLRDGRAVVNFTYQTHRLYSLDGGRANHFLQQLRFDVVALLRGALGIGISGEYFDRRTDYKDDGETRNYNFPQILAFLTWRMS